MALPVNIDLTYADDVERPSRKVHQQHHDTVHDRVNGLDSAYDAAVVAGFVGTFAAWVLTLDDVGTGGGGTAASTTFAPTGGIAATNVQAALAELDTEKGASEVVAGIDTTGVTAATTLINAAQNALTTGGVVRLPVGTIQTTIAPTRSGVTFKGAGMWATKLLPPTGTSYMMQWGAFAENVAFEDMAFDFSSVTSGHMALIDGITSRNVRFTRCRFFNVPGYTVLTQGLTGLVFESCLFHTAGTAVGSGIYATAGSRKVAVRGCTFLYCGTGVAGFNADEVEVTNSYFDQGWWLGVEKASGSGGTVTYTATTVTNSAGGFTGYIDHYVRALTVRRTASGAGVTYDYTANKVTDTGATFITAGTLKGDIVRSGSLIGVVESVESATVLVVEEWLSNTNRSHQAQPANGAAYTLYKVQLGYIRNAPTSTVATIDDWYDLAGVRSTPAAGTLYEVIAHGIYPIHFDACKGVKVTGNTLKRGWADQISLFGNEAQIIGNSIEDGQDYGITCHGAHNVIGMNRIRHQGVTGILSSILNLGDAGSSTVVGNMVSACQWTNTGISPFVAGIVIAGSNSTCTGNSVDGENLPLSRYGISVAAFANTVGDVRVVGNSLRRHNVSDLHLEQDATGTLVNFTQAANSGTVSTTGAVAAGAQSLNRIKIPTGHTGTAWEVETPVGSRLVRVDNDGALYSSYYSIFSGIFVHSGTMSHTGANLGFYGTSPVVQPAANPDTTDATLAALETEVNQLKAALRTLGLIAT